jgi:hypothetical protein
LESRPKGSNIAVALVPNIETIQWHHARENFVGMELHGKAPEVKGAIIGSEKGKRIWCLWTRMWYNNDPANAKGNTLHILRLVVEDGNWTGAVKRHGIENSVDHSHDDSIAALMLMAQREASWREGGG